MQIITSDGIGVATALRTHVITSNAEHSARVSLYRPRVAFGSNLSPALADCRLGGYNVHSIQQSPYVLILYDDAITLGPRLNQSSRRGPLARQAVRERIGGNDAQGIP